MKPISEDLPIPPRSFRFQISEALVDLHCCKACYEAQSVDPKNGRCQVLVAQSRNGFSDDANSIETRQIRCMLVVL